MKILEIGRKDFLEDNKLFSLHWSVTNNCNYNCAYCGVHQKFEEYLPEDKTDRIISYINHIENMGKRVWAALFGGEPLLHPNILTIVDKIKTTDLVAMTNLSHSLEFFKELSYTKPSIIICSTYHHERCKSFEEFKKKIEFLTDSVKYVKVKVLLDPRYKYEILEVFKEMTKIHKENYECFLDIVYHDDFKWSQEDLKLFDSFQKNKEFQIKYIDNESDSIEKTAFLSYNEVRRIYGGFPNFYMYKCETGKQGIFISPNGDVIICMSSYFAGVKPIFNLLKDDYNNFDSILSKSVICKINDFCCEHLIPRSRIFLENFLNGELTK